MTERILNDRYALEEKIGEGGMAITYRARDLLLNRTVAVKLMREQFTSDPQFVERFRREAQAAARLSHENIASVYDTGRANGMYYIVMEFVEGTDLKQRLRSEGALPVLMVLQIGQQIAAALDAAHRSGLVHRDIKPHNILLNKDGKVKVTDFGIAKLASEGEDTGVIIGSVHYISPEQARGEVTTPSSDLYSLGAVLYELLTGRTVFEANNAMAVAHKQIYERPALLRSLRSDIPPAVESMVMHCLEKDPRLRYQSAAEVQAIIGTLLAQLTQEETMVFTPTAPSMDATMVIRPTVPNLSATETTTVRVDPFQNQRPSYIEPAPRKGSAGTILAIFLVIVALAAGFIIYQRIGINRNGANPPVATIPVPSVKDMSEKEALAFLRRSGLQGVSEKVYDQPYPVGTVYDQNPAAETKIAKDATITIYVSGGHSFFVLPDVVGQSLKEAKSAILRAAQGSKITITTEKDETADLPKDQVLRTEPPAGAQVRLNEKVTLYLSTGKSVEVTESFEPGSVPDIGDPETYIRIEFENPEGSDPQIMYDGQLQPGSAIPRQTFKRKATDKVVVRIIYGKDDNSPLQELMAPLTFGPGTKATSP